jgi:hypothetical protein
MFAMRSLIFVLAFAPDTEKWNQLALRVCCCEPSQSHAVQRRNSPSASRVTSFKFAESKALEKVSSPTFFSSPVPPTLSSRMAFGTIVAAAVTGRGGSTFDGFVGDTKAGGGGDRPAGGPSSCGGSSSISAVMEKIQKRKLLRHRRNLVYFEVARPGSWFL